MKEGGKIMGRVIPEERLQHKRENRAALRRRQQKDKQGPLLIKNNGALASLDFKTGFHNSRRFRSCLRRCCAAELQSRHCLNNCARRFLKDVGLNPTKELMAIVLCFGRDLIRKNDSFPELRRHVLKTKDLVAKEAFAVLRATLMERYGYQIPNFSLRAI
ncbi:hypothetical protein A3J56_02510 [Candidatus Giovannonibacteria bacterium RIFCSPHIGHO2_02_FULL_46_20]|uniref:Uncharacterized protein n=1 Tax=Candidatus Giovannonibacteria bacterium RIFCSPHIGHO2_02_FULL_46_20 TaxID=1798338 RepID=A0A1F5WHT4_9BACT|nr:MAG: hypothetical protein A3J56_02510 [Candidatus Giovannonibacteria bacterium RIFCSPHIGHO2_02_FULL_46_20]